MAIQSAWLLSQRLVEAGRSADVALLDRIARDYEAAVRANFWLRMRAASLIAALAMRPALSGTAVALLETLPNLLACGARCAGKARALRAA
jgi:hypothetical protein